jgi:hypothetical protein
MLSNQDIKFCQKLKDRGQMKIGERQALEKKKKKLQALSLVIVLDELSAESTSGLPFNGQHLQMLKLLNCDNAAYLHKFCLPCRD